MVNKKCNTNNMIKSVFQLFLLFQINTGMYQNTFGTETERSLQFKRKGLHIPEVYSPKPAGQTNSVATYNLYHFMRQHTAYYSRRHSYYAFSASGGEGKVPGSGKEHPDG